MKYIASKAALFVAALFVTGGVWAQDHAVKATVPFAFTVDNTVLAPGTYYIANASSFREVLRIDGWEKRSHSRVIAEPNPNGSGQANELVFHRYGNLYFLSEIRDVDSSMCYRFATSKAEKTARTQTQQAGVRISNDVLVALNQ